MEWGGPESMRLRERLAEYQENKVVVSIDRLRRVDFDEPAAEDFRRLKATGVRIGTMDLKIAAIALSLNATLLSRNVVDFEKVPGLRVEDWTR